MSTSFRDSLSIVLDKAAYIVAALLMAVFIFYMVKLMGIGALIALVVVALIVGGIKIGLIWFLR